MHNTQQTLKRQNTSIIAATRNCISKATIAIAVVALSFATKGQAQTTGVWTGTSVPTTTSSGIRTNDGDLWIRAKDNNHGIGWYGLGKLFAGQNIDGPAGMAAY